MNVIASDIITAKVQASNGRYHAAIQIPQGKVARISASGSWKADPGRASHSPAGNGTRASGRYPLSDGTGEGALLMKDSATDRVYSWRGENDVHTVSGPTIVKFMMNDNYHRDNEGAITVSVEF